MDTASQLLLGQSSPATAPGVDKAAGVGLGAKAASTAKASQAQGHSEYSQPAAADKAFAEHMASAAEPVNSVNKSSRTATPHFDFSQEALLANGLTPEPALADSGNGLQFAGELLPGLLPQAMAGWSVSGQTQSAAATLSGTDPATTNNGKSGLPAGLEQQIAWQTPAGVNGQAAATTGTLAAGSAAAAPLPQQSAQAQGMVMIMDNLKQQGAAANGELLLDPEALAEQWLDGEAINSSGSNQPKSAAGQLNAIQGGQNNVINSLNSGLGQNPLAGQGAALGTGQSAEALLAANATSVQTDIAAAGVGADKLSAGLASLSASYPKVEGGGSYAQAASQSFQTSVSTPVMAQGWGDTVMQRVMWMSSQQIHSAEIQLDPPELGSLMVKINTSQEQTTVNFTSPHAAVRDALDQNLPKLRELMAEQGVDMVNVDVSEHAGQDKAEQGDDEAEAGQGGILAQQADEAGDDSQAEAAASLEPMGLVNAYV
ncbi:flagellar hook-length control protein FliK [Dasania sp. GY-MA-18]|uniref:Flagellar hook-length control protein FliK n=1 Tax=Dasania phycosphaerae TaxID=2950436 RepID=A0A9J6RI97_9GAMM|nr:MULTISPECIES: flagellar hook-length control protein FliK [Dasania]MCR8921662.1 flagellar hook-length control protein FliK [Dasania sp. GY-MA-18]MCZ0864090.1 flagellar hook-length control protein FliK [Dasania phycosphaerae]MCZ0867818.1 flagellar hook-length control protein FliK [Dasania phycosphaerae]